MRALLAFLLFGLAACYSPRAVAPGDGYTGLYGAAAYDVPLQASLWIDSHTGFRSFDLNKPAHVALFIWHPGSAFQMVHPQIGHGTRQFFHEGRNYLWPQRGTFASQRRAGYGLTDRYLASASRGGMGAYTTGPVYYVLIASEEPLLVTPFFNQGVSWAHRANWSGNLYTATELLASQIVPAPNRTDWTVAYQLVWPESPHLDYRRPQYRWIICADGTTLVVPLEALLHAAVVCPDGTQPSQIPGDTAGADPGTPPRVPPLPERRAELRGVAETLAADRADETEVREMIRRLREARGAPAEDVAVPMPTWRRGDRPAEARGATASESRPVIRPLPTPRTEDARARPPATRAEAMPRPGADRPRTPGDPRSRADRTRPQPAAAQPGVRSPRPQPETRARPAPPAERARPAPTRPAPPPPRSPPPPDGR